MEVNYVLIPEDPSSASRYYWKIQNGNIPEAIAISTFPIPNIPAAKWSLLNRTFMFIAGARGARGYRQWQEVGRYVKKKAKAFTVLAPRLIKNKAE